MAYCTINDVKKYIPDWSEEEPSLTQANEIIDDAYSQIVNVLLSVGESTTQTGDALSYLKNLNAICAAYRIEVASFNGSESDRAVALKEDCRKGLEDLRKYGLPSSTSDNQVTFTINTERTSRNFGIDEDNW